MHSTGEDGNHPFIGFVLLLAGVGLYGIVAHEIQVRRSEMGLRMALGFFAPLASFIPAVKVGGTHPAQILGEE